MKLENSVVLVTGSNRGLGRALVEAALRAGAARIYAASRQQHNLHELVARSEGRLIPLALDVTDQNSIARAAAEAKDVNLLVNNAGTLATSGVLTSSADAITSDFAVNAFGVLAMAKAFVPALERAAASGDAAIVNVLSVVSLANMPSLGAYSASKAAAYSLTQALRADLAKKNIRVHAALPGAIDTDMSRTLTVPKTTPQNVAEGIIAGIEAGVDEILPDPMARGIYETWLQSPKELERQLAANVG